MPRRIHQIQHICLAIPGLVIKPDGLRFDGDAALALNIHIIEHLLFHFAVCQTTTRLNQPVRNG